MPETVTVFRPVRQKELDLIIASDCKSFPPRLPEQPIFYPVLSEIYAAQIARDWNAKHNPDGVGYVTRFEVRREYILKHELKTVGGSMHQEYWIPAEQLEGFNANIIGKIEVTQTFTREK